MTKPAPGPAEKRAEVFVSAASGDLRTMREIVKHGLLTMGCFPVEQANFPPDFRTVHQMLEERIAGCDAVIHIVGLRYGAEPDPATLPPGASRRSYTQIEADIARQLGKKLYVFLCPDDFPYDEEPDDEGPQKQALQREYRRQVAVEQTLHTHVRDREDLALKVRELQFELEKLRGVIARDRSRSYGLLAALAIILAALAAGVWWTAARVGGEFHYDRNRTREMLAAAIRDNAGKLIAKLDPVADWRQVEQIKNEENQQLADLDHYLDSIEQTSHKGEASQNYLTATKLLQEKGVSEALDFLESTGADRADQIQQQKNRVGEAEQELRKLLKEELLEASLLEKQFRFDEAEAKYRSVVGDAGAWAEPRNDLALFLTHRGTVVDPAKGDAMLHEAVDLCQGTIALNPKSAAPQDWAAAQNYLGNALLDLAERTAGPEGAGLLAQAVAAYQHALEVRTQTQFPHDWAMTETNLGTAFEELGKRAGGPAEEKLLHQAIDAYLEALQVCTRAAAPKDWAMVCTDMGTALDHLGGDTSGPGGNKVLEDAIGLDRGALEVYTRTADPDHWAAAENNLGNALLDLGVREQGASAAALLQEAANAYQSALEVHTRADAPQVWAATEGNLGNALAGVAMAGSGETARKALEQSIEAYRSTLEVHTRADMPRDWARTEYDIGDALDQLGSNVGGAEGNKDFQGAIDAFRGALDVYTKVDDPGDWAEAEYNLGHVLDELGTRTAGATGADLLQQSVDAYNASLEVYGNGSPEDKAETIQSRDGALADLTKAKAALASPGAPH